jgi:CspA family cold shock protein
VAVKNKQTKSSNIMFQGRVKWFNRTNGIGFIRNLDTNEDVFVHHSELKTRIECYRYLTEGEYVQFEESQAASPHKKQAKNVTGIRGFELLCEVRGASNIAEGRGGEGRGGGGNAESSHPPRRNFGGNRRRESNLAAGSAVDTIANSDEAATSTTIAEEM